MAESKLTIGSIIGVMFMMVIMMGIIGPVAIGIGVFNSGINATTPQGQYITSIFGSNGLEVYANSSINQDFIPYANNASNSTLLSVTGLTQSSGYAFIPAGIFTFFKSLGEFPKFIYVMTLGLFSNNGITRYLPFDIAGLLSSAILTYCSVILGLKVLSIFGKPASSIENI